MTIKQFIEKAIEGGWEKRTSFLTSDVGKKGYVILDPKAWQAVGKVEGWDEDRNPAIDVGDLPPLGITWRTQMHSMIDALAEGKSIEEFIETL